MIILSLFLAGLISGLIQFFVDFKGLQLYQEQKPADASGGAELFQGRFVSFLKSHWQLIGYLVVGIAGAMLVPVINEVTPLKGTREALDCIQGNQVCKSLIWNLLTILGWGIISGYSSVRLIRSLGSFIVGNFSKQQQDLQKTIDDQQRKLVELAKQLDMLKGQHGTGGGIIKTGIQVGKNLTSAAGGGPPTINTYIFSVLWEGDGICTLFTLQGKTDHGSWQQIVTKAVTDTDCEISAEVGSFTKDINVTIGFVIVPVTDVSKLSVFVTNKQSSLTQKILPGGQDTKDMKKGGDNWSDSFSFKTF